VLIAMFAFAPQGAGAAQIVCPAQLPAAETSFEQVGPTPPKTATLDTMRLFDGPPGEEQRQFPAELAPDSAIQKHGTLTSTWIFAGNENLLLICDYRGTKTYYRTHVPHIPKTCTLHREAHQTTTSCE
jgi:hypothetical protein